MVGLSRFIKRSRGPPRVRDAPEKSSLITDAQSLSTIMANCKIVEIENEMNNRVEVAVSRWVWMGDLDNEAKQIQNVCETLKVALSATYL